MNDDEIRALAKLLLPYREQVEAIWNRSRLRSAVRESSAPTELLTVAEAAALLGLKSGSTIYRLISTGQLTAVDIGQGKTAKTRIRRDHLQSYIESRTRRAPQVRRW